MKKPYKSIFLLPLRTESEFTEDGWAFSFHEAQSLSKFLVKKALENLKLSLSEEFLGKKKFKSESLEAIVTFTDNEIPKKIMFKLYDILKDDFLILLDMDVEKYDAFLFDAEEEFKQLSD